MEIKNFVSIEEGILKLVREAKTKLALALPSDEEKGGVASSECPEGGVVT